MHAVHVHAHALCEPRVGNQSGTQSDEDRLQLGLPNRRQRRHVDALYASRTARAAIVRCVVRGAVGLVCA